MHVHIFIMHARRDTKSDIVIQMILEQVLVQRFKKKEMDEKNNFKRRHVNVPKRASSCRGMT